MATTELPTPSLEHSAAKLSVSLASNFQEIKRTQFGSRVPGPSEMLCVMGIQWASDGDGCDEDDGAHGNCLARLGRN
jgi:hypothetical protein